MKGACSMYALGQGREGQPRGCVQGKLQRKAFWHGVRRVVQVALCVGFVAGVAYKVRRARC